jgi:hypothetical protein
MHTFGTIPLNNLAPIFFFSRLKPLIYIGLAFIQQALGNKLVYAVNSQSLRNIKFSSHYTHAMYC